MVVVYSNKAISFFSAFSRSESGGRCCCVEARMFHKSGEKNVLEE